MRVEGRFIRQTWWARPVWTLLAGTGTLESGQGYIFENKIVGGAIPKEYILAIDAGIREAMSTGGAGQVIRLLTLRQLWWTVVTMMWILQKWLFKIAGSIALKRVLTMVKTGALEPVMKVEVNNT